MAAAGGVPARQRPLSAGLRDARAGPRRAGHAIAAVALSVLVASVTVTRAGDPGDDGTARGPAPSATGSSATGSSAAPGAVTARSVTGPSATGRGLKRVRYLGYTFLVPRSWPVIDDRSRLGACVRFDQHAVYLGAVRADEFCPSWLIGTTESMLIEPGPARARETATENLVARRITVRAPRVAVTATFDADPAVISRILASASLPVPRGGGGQPASARARAAGRTPGAGRASGPGRTRSPMPVPFLPASVAAYRGLGFDACAAPSRRYMNAWRRRSPYRAIGVYIGGADRACAQPNLTQSWVRAQARAGWRFIPLYAGPQAAFGEIHAPVRQGTAAARDAVRQAQRLGFGRRTPIYYDMEAYPVRRRAGALQFLSAWTRELHRLRYRSGVYSSSDAGVRDLSRRYSGHSSTMPDIIYDALWNGSKTTRDRNIGAYQWARHQRIHQFRGNVTQQYGGFRINVDQDYLDVRFARPAMTPQATQAVTLPDRSVDLFYQSGGHRLSFARYRPGKGWTRPARTSARAWSAPSVVWTGSAVDVLYKGPGGYLWLDSYTPGGKLTGSRRLTMMGVLGSGPRAVAQGDGEIDAFWRGSADDHLWHGQYVPALGWSGPQALGGDLASPPSPVVSGPGTTSVFWKGTDRSLWRVSRGVSGRWSAPASLGMGPLGGPPQATAQPAGGIEVCWEGSGNPHLWEGFYQPKTGWRGPRDLGGVVRSLPWPATAAGDVRILWRGPGHRLAGIVHRPGQGWNYPGWRAGAPLRGNWIGSAPFAAVGGQGAGLWVFWSGRHGWMWATSLKAGRWTAPLRLSAARG